MPEQFTVPQFIDAEDKIFGPITARQFVILVVAFMTDALLYRLLPFVWFLAIAIPIFAIAIVFAFTRINGVAFHYFLLNIIQTLKKPGLRIWDKRISDAVLRSLVKKAEEPPPPPPPRKAPISRSKLQELTLVVNTGGVYTPDE